MSELKTDRALRIVRSRAEAWRARAVTAESPGARAGATILADELDALLAELRRELRP